jgi:hypothetical protein
MDINNNRHSARPHNAGYSLSELTVRALAREEFLLLAPRLVGGYTSAIVVEIMFLTMHNLLFAGCATLRVVIVALIPQIACDCDLTPGANGDRARIISAAAETAEFVDGVSRGGAGVEERHRCQNDADEHAEPGSFLFHRA